MSSLISTVAGKVARSSCKLSWISGGTATGWIASSLPLLKARTRATSAFARSVASRMAVSESAGF